MGGNGRGTRRVGRHEDQGGGHRAKAGESSAAMRGDIGRNRLHRALPSSRPHGRDAQFVHPQAQRVMALKCEGTDTPGSRPNRNGAR